MSTFNIDVILKLLWLFYFVLITVNKEVDKVKIGTRRHSSIPPDDQ